MEVENEENNNEQNEDNNEMQHDPDEYFPIESIKYVKTTRELDEFSNNLRIVIHYLVKYENYNGHEYIKSTQIQNYDTPEWRNIHRHVYDIRNHRIKWYDLIGDSSNVPKTFKNEVIPFFNISIKILYHDNKNYCIIYSICNILYLKNNIKSQIIKINDSGYCNFNTLQRIITQLQYGYYIIYIIILFNILNRNYLRES